MRKYTQRELKAAVALGYAEDITNYSDTEIYNLSKGAELEKVGYTSGIYGIAGGLLEDKNTGKKYAILARNSVLFYFF